MSEWAFPGSNCISTRAPGLSEAAGMRVTVSNCIRRYDMSPDDFWKHPQTEALVGDRDGENDKA